MYLDYYNYIMALTLIKDSDLKKGADALKVNDAIPGIKTSTKDTCRCKGSTCKCVRSGIPVLPPVGVVGLPLDYNLQNLLQNPAFALENDLMNRFRLQALISQSTVTRDAYASEIFSQNWNPYPHPMVTADQICYLNQNPKRKKFKDGPNLSPPLPAENTDRNLYTSPVPSPISIPSPISAENAIERISHAAPISPTNFTTVVNGNKKKFICMECNRSFDYKHVLLNHIRTHTGEKPFQCNTCSKKFTRDHHLKTHIRTHTGEKPYVCAYCPMRFGQVANLRRHEKVHTGDRPYLCEQCSARFSDTNQLKAHEARHKLEKPSILGEALTEIVTVTIPVQTEPEDLSVKKYHSINNNNSSSSAGDSSRSSSPMDS